MFLPCDEEETALSFTTGLRVLPATIGLLFTEDGVVPVSAPLVAGAFACFFEVGSVVVAFTMAMLVERFNSMAGEAGGLTALVGLLLAALDTGEVMFGVGAEAAVFVV
jgi:hypothetical protein